MKGIVLGTDGDFLIANGGVIIDDTEMQETAIIAGMNQGEDKFTPVLGPNLMQLLKAKASKFDIEQRMRVHLAKDGKDYSTLKNKINTTIR